MKEGPSRNQNRNIKKILILGAIIILAISVIGYLFGLVPGSDSPHTGQTSTRISLERKGVKETSFLWLEASDNDYYIRFRDRGVLEYRRGNLTDQERMDIETLISNEGFWDLDNAYSAASDPLTVVETDRATVEVVKESRTKKVNADMQAAPANLVTIIRQLEEVTGKLSRNKFDGYLLRSRPLNQKLLIGSRSLTEGERLREKGVTFYSLDKIPSELSNLISQTLDPDGTPFISVEPALEEPLLDFMLSDKDGQRQQYITQKNNDYVVELFTFNP